MRRPILLPRLALLAGIAAGLPALFGCLKHPLKPVQYDAAIEDDKIINLVVNRDVDVLFVIDNSGSMGEEQGLLAKNFSKFIEVLEQEDVKANYRIGVTTTDVINPVCGGGTTPENGKLQFSSCRSRANDFVFDPAGPNEKDKYDQACADHCDFEEVETLETPADDGNTESRRWLQNQEGELNVEDMTATEAFQCFGPQGINGCGFESQLESMYKALRLSDDSNSTQFSFIRPDAILAVVIVSDELDCSFNEDHKEIFTDEDSPFWHEDASGRAYSSICWNAGVKCSGDGQPYTECEPQDYDIDGGDADSGSDAVLHPISRYIDLLQSYEDQKQASNQTQEVIVSVLGGVPPGYAAGTADLFYSKGDDLKELNFGVAPGCTSSVEGELQEAYPPVRMRRWAEAFDNDGNDERNLFSICNDDYGPALEAIAEKIKEQIQPACFQQCARDIDPGEPGVQIECEITQRQEGVETKIGECERDGTNGPYAWEDDDFVVPMGEDACYAVLSDDPDDEITDDPNDNMSDECVEADWNLEFKLRRRPGAPAKPGTTVSATCSLSEAPDIDCASD